MTFRPSKNRKRSDRMRLVLGAWVVSSLLVQAAGHCESPPSEGSTGCRTEDPIALAFGDLASWAGEDPGKLSLYRIENGAALPVGWQFDEVDVDGGLVLDKGPQPGADSDNGKIDANDLIVFQADALGSRNLERDRFAGKGYAEIEVRDPVDGSRRYAYLVKGAGPGAEDTVSLERSSEGIVIRGRRYQLRHSRDRYFIDQLSLRTNGDAKFGPNLLDRSKMRASFRLKWFWAMFALKTFNKSEDSVRYQIRAWKDGPIRVILQGRPRTQVVPKVSLPSAWANSFYYRDHCVLSSYIVNSTNLANLCAHATFRAAYDFSTEARQMTFYSSEVEEGLLVNGTMDEKEKAVPGDIPGWFALAGSKGAIVGQYQMSEVLQELPNRFQYLDQTADKTRRQEREGGGTPEIGFEFDVKTLKKGKYKVDNHLCFLAEYHKGDEERCLQMLNAPLEASFTRVVH